MNTLYCAPGTTIDADITTAVIDRAVYFNAELIKGDPTGLTTVPFSVIVTSTAVADAVFPDNTGHATLAEVQAAQINATNAETTKATNIANAKSSSNT